MIIVRCVLFKDGELSNWQYWASFRTQPQHLHIIQSEVEVTCKTFLSSGDAKTLTVLQAKYPCTYVHTYMNADFVFNAQNMYLYGNRDNYNFKAPVKM